MDNVNTINTVFKIIKPALKNNYYLELIIQNNEKHYRINEAYLIVIFSVNYLHQIWSLL